MHLVLGRPASRRPGSVDAVRSRSLLLCKRHLAGSSAPKSADSRPHRAPPSTVSYTRSASNRATAATTPWLPTPPTQGPSLSSRGPRPPWAQPARRAKARTRCPAQTTWTRLPPTTTTTTTTRAASGTRPRCTRRSSTRWRRLSTRAMVSPPARLCAAVYGS
jgi:hypothetical protein